VEVARNLLAASQTRSSSLTNVSCELEDLSLSADLTVTYNADCSTFQPVKVLWPVPTKQEPPLEECEFIPEPPPEEEEQVEEPEEQQEQETPTELEP